MYGITQVYISGIRLVSVRLNAHYTNRYLYFYACLHIKVAAKQVTHKATVVDNESHEVSQMEDEIHPLINQKVKWKIEWKPMIFGHTYFEIDSSENNKAICLTCKERIAWGGSMPIKFNTSNPCKHLMTHKNEYKHFVKNEKKREEAIKKKGNGSKPH